ncbi:MAG TPA: phosphodiesterase [Solirubrobacteraceae bacterium]|nr:phosphodiesterase [Solirubrobacteraceae bacterium]
MSAPFLVAQISDPHIGGDWGGADPVAGLTRALDAVFAMPDRPDVLLVTGDLVEHGTGEEYDLVHRLLATSPAPVHVLPGNHDLREGLRARFGLPGDAAAPVQYSADLGPLRLVALDTTIPGRAAGELDAPRLSWLDAELADAPQQPTLLAMHHPPASTGIAPWDAIGLEASGRAGLEQILGRHPQVGRVVAGHIHQPLVSTLAGRAVLAIPSTYVQARLDFTSAEIELDGGIPGFAIHALVDGHLASYLHTIAG